MPKYMIHACPSRLWYVEDFLIPSMTAQGIKREDITVWNDTERMGNLAACMAAFESCTGDGGTWHLQDDVVISADFAEKTREFDRGVVYGFCSRYFTDDVDIAGEVYAEDAWHSFQCVRIPNEYARGCAAWVKAGGPFSAEGEILIKLNKGDDTLFREYFITYHGTDTAVNLSPNIVNHVDYLVGGPVTNQWRGYIVGSDKWADSSIISELQTKLKERGR